MNNSFSCLQKSYYQNYLNPPNVYSTVVEEPGPDALSVFEKVLPTLKLKSNFSLSGKIIRAVGRSIYGTCVVLPMAVKDTINPIDKPSWAINLVVSAALGVTTLINGILAVIGVAAMYFCPAPFVYLFLPVIPAIAIIVLAQGIFIQLVDMVNSSKSPQHLAYYLRQNAGIVGQDGLPIPTRVDDDQFYIGNGEDQSTWSQGAKRLRKLENQWGGTYQGQLIAKVFEELHKSQPAEPEIHPFSPYQEMSPCPEHWKQIIDLGLKFPNAVRYADFLELPVGYTEDQLKKAKREYAVKTHPDRGGSDLQFTLYQQIIGRLS